MNKKQVGAFLKVLSKDTAREVLTTAHVTEHEGKAVLVATDGYVMALINLDKEDAEQIMHKSVRREALERWYKLSTGKSRLDTRELVSVFNEDFAMHGESTKEFKGLKYPDITAVIKAQEDKEEKAIDKLTFNADYVKTMQDLAGKTLTYRTNGTLGALIADTDMGKFIIMPMKG